MNRGRHRTRSINLNKAIDLIMNNHFMSFPLKVWAYSAVEPINTTIGMRYFTLIGITHRSDIRNYFICVIGNYEKVIFNNLKLK